MNKKLKTICKYIKWSEIAGLSLVFLIFIYIIANQNSLCLTNDCEFLFSSQNGFYGMVYSYLFLAFSLLGIFRIYLLDIIKNEFNSKRLTFYFGVFGIAIASVILSIYHDEFLFVYKQKELLQESSIVTLQVLLVAISSFLLFYNKKNWDKSEFIAKVKLAIYCFNLVLFTMNINVGSLFFLLSIPAIISSEFIVIKVIR